MTKPIAPIGPHSDATPAACVGLLDSVELNQFPIQRRMRVAIFGLNSQTRKTKTPGTCPGV